MTRKALKDYSSTTLNQKIIPVVSNNNLSKQMNIIRSKMDRITYDVD